MQTTESCRFCERILLTVETTTTLHSLLDLPNTFNAKKKHYTWKQFDVMRYALIPKSVQGTRGELELYLCMDEDDLDDRDLLNYARKFVETRVFPRDTGSRVQFLGPMLSTPEAVPCWKMHHEEHEEQEEAIENE